MNAMDVVTREDIKALVERRHGPCVSIYQPTHRAGPDTRTYALQDPIRFRNLLREAEQRLAAGAVSARAVDELLQPARRLVDDSAPGSTRPMGWPSSSLGIRCEPSGCCCTSTN